MMSSLLETDLAYKPGTLTLGFVLDGRACCCKQHMHIPKKMVRRSREGGRKRQELHLTNMPSRSNLAHKSKEQSADGKNPDLKRHFYVHYLAVQA